MPDITIPLAGNPTTRGWNTTTPYAKDQIYKGVVFQQVPDAVTGSASFFVQKRVGMGVDTSAIQAAVGTSIFLSQPYSFSANNIKIVSFGEQTTGSTVYHRTGSTTTNCGTTIISGTGYVVRHTSEVKFSGVTYWLLSSVTATAGIPTQTRGWYVASDAIAASNTFTGDRTSGSPIVTNVSSLAGLHVGQIAAGTGFASGNRIASIDGPTQVTMTENASSGAPTNTTFTREDIALILSANFPANITGAFQELDGRIYIMDTLGNVWGAEPNQCDIWMASNKFVCNAYTDTGIGLGKWKTLLLAFGSSSCEFLKNGGTSFGSQLVRESALNIGARVASKTPFKALIATGFDTVAWITGDKLPKVYYWSGELNDISFPNISTVLSGWESFVEGWSLGMWSAMGQHFICTSAALTGPSYINQTFSLESKSWVDQNFHDALTMDESPNANGFALETTLTTGNIYFPNGAVFQDNSVNFTVSAQTIAYALNDGLPFYIDDVQVLADTQSAGSMLLESTANDYASFGTIGSFPLTVQQKRLPCGGYYDRDVAFRATYAGNTPFRAQALKITYRAAP